MVLEALPALLELLNDDFADADADAAVAVVAAEAADAVAA